jgi:hypothetical protein
MYPIITVLFEGKKVQETIVFAINLRSLIVPVQ